MNEPLEVSIRRLAAEPTDRFLDGLEAELSRDIRLRRRESRLTAAVAPIGAGAVALALALGLAVGGVTAAAAGAPAGVDGLAGAARLAPSTLLDGGR